MQEVHTHTFVGGPKDGQREAIFRAEQGLGRVEIRLPAGRVAYERAAFEGEKVRFIYWKAQGLTIDDALRRLFSHYIERAG